MPWCDECAKFWNPPSLRDGTCPTCGAVLDDPAAGHLPDRPSAPWHFKVLLVAIVIYLGYRAYQGVFLAIHFFF